MEIKERYNLEFKEHSSKTFLKTVSTYANYNDGEIVFGVDDAGNIVGMYDVQNENIRSHFHNVKQASPDE